jgi:hypothetical protein
LWIEKVIREELAPSIEVECWKDFETKDYNVWLTLNGRHLLAPFTMEEYQDGLWKATVQKTLEELNQ